MVYSIVSHAQTQFAPQGASWHHEMQYGSFHCYTSGDTVIQGVTAMVIRQKALTKPPWFGWGLHVHDLPDRYFYSNSDTVFVYNHIFNRFTPLYIFNVQEGDTLNLPVLPTAPGSLYGNYPDSSFHLVIDSIRVRQYDTAFLKTYFTRDIGTMGSDFRYNWGAESHGAYAEKIGGVYSGLLPYCYSCAYPASDLLQSAGSLRCYSDSVTSIKLVANNCDDDGIGLSTKDLARGAPVQIFPVPADEVFHIKASGREKVVKADVFNIKGRKYSPSLRWSRQVYL
jgi:hypothetical protein